MNKYLFQIKSNVGCVYRGIQEATKSWDSKIRTCYAYFYKYCKVKKNVVLYEAYFGKGLLCNPYAIFLELINNPKYAELQHVWVVKDPANPEIDRYKNCRNVKFVKFQSKQYLKYLCTAKYLINNVTFPNYFIKKADQIYVNTWHGIPLKTLGYDVPNGNVEISNVIRNFLQTDYLISASPFLTDIYQKTHKLENIYQGKIIAEGYPRLDLLVRFDREAIFGKLRRYGVEADPDKQVVLFAPTWRGKSYAHASSDVSSYYEFKQRIEETIDTSKYQVLIKVHQRVYELAKNKLQEGFFIPSMIDANEVLSITDILVSDFSSIYFDFLATGKPVLFYIPDIDNYSQERGLYRSTDCLPGPCTSSLSDIADWINRIDEVKQQYLEKYNAERQWSNGYHAGEISRKIVDIVFEQHENGYKIHLPSQRKKRILISRGKMLVNGISMSLLSLLDNIDYEEFDVSVMVCTTSAEKERALINRINPKARVLCRNSADCYTIWEHVLHIHAARSGRTNARHDMYARTRKRSYGDVSFDYVVDYEGYNSYYSVLALQFPEARKCVWQHSDMFAERNTKYAWLDNIFSLYPYFDKIVSCSYDVMLVNRDNLAGTYCDASQFTYMENFVDVGRITNSLQQDVIRNYEGKPFVAMAEHIINGCVNVKLLPLQPKENEAGERQYRFVTVGRFSVEKNHENLIQAFHKLRQENPNVYLYILGDGKLKKQTDTLIASLGLENCVITPGNVENPFAVMRQCDCFILPSLHEGQPMVISEARVLQMPIIVSNFSSVDGILIENGQLLIDTSVDGIYEGMRKYIAGEVPEGYAFDAAAYNRKVYQEFLNALN